jgi:hypothetical protein
MIYTHVSCDASTFVQKEKVNANNELWTTSVAVATVVRRCSSFRQNHELACTQLPLGSRTGSAPVYPSVVEILIGVEGLAKQPPRRRDCPPVLVTAMLSCWPASPASDCQLAPQFLDIWIHPVLLPLIHAAPTEPLPERFLMLTSFEVIGAGDGEAHAAAARALDPLVEHRHDAGAVDADRLPRRL